VTPATVTLKNDSCYSYSFAIPLLMEPLCTQNIGASIRRLKAD